MDDSESSIPKHRLRKFVAALTLLLGIFLFVVHYFQFDSLAPVTLIPPWLWLIPAASLTLFAWSGVSRSTAIALLLVTVLFAACFVEEARSLLRFGTQPAEHPDTTRIATMNCNIGSKGALLAPKQFNPDVVLFQESPGADTIDSMSKTYFGETGNAIHGGDVSLIANGSIEAVHVDRSSHFLHAVVTLPTGTTFDVVCLRLSAPVFRVDCTSAGFWSDHARTRKLHRKQLEEIHQHLRQSARTDHWIIGGDFNLVGNDGALTAFAGLKDTFYESGTGLCNTGTSDYPLFRVDQLWTSGNVSSKISKAYKTEHSDHRLVIADLRIFQ
jgi:endonuclease/exonuclease/phosphatase family metal-dependent hydrolase